MVLIGVKKRVSATFREIDIDKLVEPSEDLRFFRSDKFADVLLRDLRREGSIIPVLVRSLPDSDAYQIIDGINRVRELRNLSVRSVMCQILDVDDKTSITLALKMNIYRKSHDPVGMGKAFKALHKHGVKYKDIAKNFNLTRGWVSKLVALTRLPLEIQNLCARGDMTVKEALEYSDRGYTQIAPFLDERRKSKCDVCGHACDAGTTQSLNVCRECGADLDKIRLRREQKIRRDMERSARPKDQRLLSE